MGELPSYGPGKMLADYDVAKVTFPFYFISCLGSPSLPAFFCARRFPMPRISDGLESTYAYICLVLYTFGDFPPNDESRL